jgi:hypothetical protein
MRYKKQERTTVVKANLTCSGGGFLVLTHAVVIKVVLSMTKYRMQQ